MRLRISHTTRYTFDTPVSYGLQQLRKSPKSSRVQSVLDWGTTVDGGKKELSFEDYHHNFVELISFEKGTSELTVRSRGEIEVAETHGVIGPHIGPVPLWLFKHSTVLTKPGQACRAVVREVEGDTDLKRLHALSKIIYDAVTYETGSSEPSWTVEDILAEGRGVCQDHAHVFIACARELGFPARYVSGYLMMNDRIDQEASHAWAEVFVDGLGWVGFDVSNQISPDVRYVRVATGLDYSEAAPVSGTTFGGQGEKLSVEIEVAQQ